MTQTETYCTGWFANLSSKFLSVPATKMVFLAGIDRDLYVGKMKGKFQMQVPTSSGTRSIWRCTCIIWVFQIKFISKSLNRYIFWFIVLSKAFRGILFTVKFFTGVLSFSKCFRFCWCYFFKWNFIVCCKVV